MEIKFVLQSKKTPATPFCEIMNEYERSFGESGLTLSSLNRRHLRKVRNRIHLYVPFVCENNWQNDICFRCGILKDTGRNLNTYIIFSFFFIFLPAHFRLPWSQHDYQFWHILGRETKAHKNISSSVYITLGHPRWWAAAGDHRSDWPTSCQSALFISNVACEVEFPRLQHIHGLLP